MYEIQHGGTVGHKVWNLPQITIGEDNTEESVAGDTQGNILCIRYIVEDAT